MEFDISLGLIGWMVLLVGAGIVGFAGQLIGEPGFGYEWLVTAGGAAFGGLVASEMIVGWRAVEPVVDGLALLPAAIGGLALGIVVAVITRALTGGGYWDRLASE